MQKVLITLLIVGIVFVYGQTSPRPSVSRGAMRNNGTSRSNTSRSATPSPNYNSNYTSSNNTDYKFICKHQNNYDFRTWVPMGNFLSLDAGQPANWVVTRSTARSSLKPNGSPTAILSPDVWTGRVKFTGYMKALGAGQARTLGFLFGMVSPRTKFLLLEWSNDALQQSGCTVPTVTTAYGLTLPGVVLRSVQNPLGDSAVQQICNINSPSDQTNVTTILYAQDTNNLARREVDTAYWFNLTMDTFNNSVDYSIQKLNSSGRIIAKGMISIPNHELSNNFSLGRIGAYVSGGAAMFSNWTVTPETCVDDYFANCGYFCSPQFNTSMTYSESPGRDYEDEGSNEGLHWYAILLIILAILICCCCICVIVAAIVVFLRR